MAKTSSVAKNERRKATVARYAAKRRELKDVLENFKASADAKEAAYEKGEQLVVKDINPHYLSRQVIITDGNKGSNHL